MWRLYLALDDCLRRAWHDRLQPARRSLSLYRSRCASVDERLNATRREVFETDRRARENWIEHERIRGAAAALPGPLSGLLFEVGKEVHRIAPMLRVYGQIVRQHGAEWRQLYEQRNLTMHEVLHDFTRGRRERVQRQLEFEFKRRIRLNEEEEKLKARLVRIRKQTLLDSWFAGNFSVPALPPVPNVTAVSEGPSCTALDRCADCLAVEWCGWCAMSATCMEGTERDGPIFGECGYHWRHQDGAQCDGSRPAPAPFNARASGATRPPLCPSPPLPPLARSGRAALHRSGGHGRAVDRVRAAQVGRAGTHVRPHAALVVRRVA